MNSLALRLAVVTSVLLCAALAAQDGWTSLFDGKTLSGWTQKNGTATYRVEKGTIVGKTDSKCERVFGKSNTTLDYAATMFKLLGIDDTKEFHANDGRPIQVNNGGVPIDGVIA